MYSEMVEVKEDLEQHGNIMAIKMKDLREAHGTDALGSTVVKEISQKLDTLGIKHKPDKLPQRQHHWVLIYKQADELSRAIFTPSADSNKVLEKTLGAKDEETIQKIRELVNK